MLDDSLLSLRTEITFMPTRREQPVYGQTEAFLRERGFLPMGLNALVHWRRQTTAKYPQSSDTVIPFSRGQLVHGDALFFRDPSRLAIDDPMPRIKAAFLAMASGYVDHAYSLVKATPAEAFLADRFGVQVDREFRLVSLFQQRAYHRSRRFEGLGAAGRLLRKILGS